MSGIEQRIAEWDKARCEYDISYAVRGKADLLSEVIKLWRDRLGPAYPFRFKDWSDYSAEDVNIGTGDGATVAFQLIKSYSLIYVVDRIIQLPVEGTVAITVGGEETTESTDYTVNYATGTVTFTGGSIPQPGCSCGQVSNSTYRCALPMTRSRFR